MQLEQSANGSPVDAAPAAEPAAAPDPGPTPAPAPVLSSAATTPGVGGAAANGAGTAPGGAAPAPTARRKRAAALPRELADFLVEFSIVLHNRSMYPVGHPHLQRAADRFTQRLERVLTSRDAVVLGVAHRQLLVDGVATDPENALLRDLAIRLHRHQLSSVRFEGGVSLGEIDDLIGALAADPTRGDGPLGHRLERTSHWKRLQLTPAQYDKLSLRQDAPLQLLDDDRDSDSLWIGLARLSVGATGDGVPDSSAVARAIESHAGEVAYDSVVLEYLSRIAEEMSGRLSPAEDRLRQRVSELIRRLDPETLRRLLESGADQSAVRRFTLDSAQVLAVDAVVEVLEAAAGACGQTISHQFLRLLHKLAHHAEYGPDRVRNEAAGALRQQVAQLAAGWALDDPNPAGYTAVLEQMGRDRPWDVVPGTALEAEPEDVLRIALEVGTAGPRVVAAADALAARGRLGALLELLVAAPPGEARDALWRHVATPERLRANVAGETGDRHIAELLAMRLGSEAIGPLLDALAAAEQRATRAWLLRFLTRFGEAAAAGAAARLDGAPWFVQRNFLVLIHRIGEWPPGFTPEPYLAHSQPAVRHEAVKLALAREDLRTSSLLAALGDPDPRVVALGIRASCIECPPAAVPALEALATDPRFDDEVRARAVRALGRSRTEGARARLVELAVTRRRWLPARLAPKSPLVLEALAALGAYWKDDPAAAEVVDMALRHPDPAYAAAARRIA